MSEYRHSFIISLNEVEKYWKIVDLSSIFLLFILRPNNPIFKISLALHVGLQIILIFLYSPLIYYKAANDNSNANLSSSKGLLQRIKSFLPNTIKLISIFGLKLFLKFLRLSGINKKRLNFNINKLGSVISYLLIMIRKSISLLVSIYVTSEDNESTHLKAFILFSIFMSIQMSFISNLNNKSINKNSNVTLKSSMKLLLFNTNDIKYNNKLELLIFLRKNISIICTLLTVLLIYYTNNHVAESIDDDFISMFIMKSLIFVDSAFISTFFVELSGLKLTFSNTEDTIV
ncbi:hypothetical protein C6P40_000179 [Pichia californica]|uniref:CWH43-like N-terminal domain-containing protein n=1 Tax=Pichia californica TaxID=460514 RepID=A0A9P6WMZ2_9ASCO|nr:hypothetical protein C6P42_003665 [[Candida] californica]KAG0689077.1 hypothetical protein C6P40_000179 [[Candida] californica]